MDSTTGDGSMTKLVEYPRDERGKILLRGPLAQQLKNLPVIPKEQIGGLDWTFQNMFGSVEKGIRLVESLVVGQGSRADKDWAMFLLAYQSEKERAAAHGEGVPSLNSIAAALDLKVSDLVGKMVEGVTQLNLALAKVQVASAMPALVDSAIQSAMTLEGGKDREMLFKVGGLIQDQKGGVNVSVSQNVGVSVKQQAEALKNPLRQFRDDMAEIDRAVRDGSVVDGEVVEMPV